MSLERQIGGGREAPTASPPGFRRRRLAPGEYHLLVTLTDPTGATQTSTAAFTVAQPAERG